ncbi:hypothetical protein P4B35_06670 [Pontiellaceae bacterium B12227]|nr:hypothetical protein [Pontiellaceae bacterium B12227]
MSRLKLLLSIVTALPFMQATAAIPHGVETYPAGAASLKTVTVTGPVAPPKLMRAEKGVKVILSGTGGTCGVVKRLGSFQRKGEYVYVSTRLSNPTPSFVAVEFQLYNASEKRILAKTDPVVIRNNESPAVNLALEYRAAPQDVGDNLVLCWVQTSTEHPSRSFCIEQTEVVGIRPMAVVETFPGGDPARLESAVFTGEAALPTLVKTMNDADNGDGKSDGAVAVYSAELGGTYGVVWKLGNVETAGKLLRFETVWYAAGNSFVAVDVQLYNATTEVVLASSGELPAKNIDAPPTVAAFDYELQASDKDCELEVRWVQVSTDHTSRNFIIDRFSVSETKQ